MDNEQKPVEKTKGKIDEMVLQPNKGGNPRAARSSEMKKGGKRADRVLRRFE